MISQKRHRNVAIQCPPRTATAAEDSATVNVHVTAVADAPKVTFEVLTPHDDDPINVIRLEDDPAKGQDVDCSEFIDCIAFDAVPRGRLEVQPPTAI